MRPHTPEQSAALQVLYHCADRASANGRTILFRVIRHLTGQPVSLIARLWAATR